MNESLALRFLPPALASAVVGLVVANRPLAALPRGIAIACLVASWGAAVLFRRSDVRAHATVVVAIGAVTAAGQVDAGVPYAVGCLLFLVGSLVSMRAARSLRPPRAERSQTRTLVVLGLVGTVVGSALLVGLPRLSAHIERRLNAMFEGDGDQATAFSTTMVLGSTRGMLESDAIVMRIDGERPEYLRGAVYNRYAPPFWVTTERGRARTSVPAARPAAPSATRVTLVRGTPNGDDMRWFVPEHACDLVVASRAVEIDAFGIARRTHGEDPQVLAYRTTACARPPILPAPPDKDDLDIPPDVRRSLGPVAKTWTASAATPRAKLDAIMRELGHFDYSLAVARDAELDPVVDFLTVHRAGHCELFASAMVLLARAEGIPARVVGGYRVSEVNPLTGRTVVRDRNAHAWVEAWVDGAWRRWDPTPVGETFRRRSSTVEDLGDVLSNASDVVVTALSKLGTLGVAGILGVLIVVLLFVRWLETHLRTRRGRRLRAKADTALPLPCFDELTDELTKVGHPRDESEPLEEFAHRMALVSAPWGRAVAAALLEYARFRYGGIGEQDDVVRAVERATRTVRSP